MKKLHFIAWAPILAFTTQLAIAEPVDSGPPAQQQKDAVTNSTSDGNYLKDEAGTSVTEDASQTTDATSDTNMKSDTDKATDANMKSDTDMATDDQHNKNVKTDGKHKGKYDAPPPLKGKSHKVPPEKGGVEYQEKK